MPLDPSALLCLLHGPEPYHDEAEEAFDAASRRLTHSYILAEFVALAHVRGVPRSVALPFVDDLSDSPEIELVWVGESLHRAALALLRARPDKTYSLCDAVSFVLMRRHGIREALTTDHHFEQEGFRRLLG